MPQSSQQLAFVVIISISLIFINSSQLAFAERNIHFEKVLDINKESFETILEDLDSLPKIFPDFIESVESTDNEDKKVAKMVLSLNGFHVYPRVEYTNKMNDLHLLEVASGDFRGTKLTTNFEETWGFDGTPNQGTIVNIEMDLHYSGLASFLGIVSDDDLLYSVDRFLIDTVSYVNSDQEDNSQVQIKNNKSGDEDESKYNKSKGHRRR